MGKMTRRLTSTTDKMQRIINVVKIRASPVFLPSSTTVTALSDYTWGSNDDG